MSLLPKNERREIKEVQKKKLWIYGGTMTGKTTFADNAPEPLMLNTDGNIKFVTSPYITIKDKVNMTGRIKNVKLAWEYFKEIISELEEKNNTFKTIIADLTEDLFQHCRLFIYDREGIKHESDNSFKMWDVVRTEYLSTMQRLLNLPYDNFILISHEDISRDITNQKGDNITQIKPNIQDKVALKLVGMVDAVGRVIIDNEKRYLSFKTDNVTFGGKRIPIKVDKIPLQYGEFEKLYNINK